MKQCWPEALLSCAARWSEAWSWWLSRRGESSMLINFQPNFVKLSYSWKSTVAKRLESFQLIVSHQHFHNCASDDIALGGLTLFLLITERSKKKSEPEHPWIIFFSTQQHFKTAMGSATKIKYFPELCLDEKVDFAFYLGSLWIFILFKYAFHVKHESHFMLRCEPHHEAQRTTRKMRAGKEEDEKKRVNKFRYWINNWKVVFVVRRGPRNALSCEARRDLPR